MNTVSTKYEILETIEESDAIKPVVVMTEEDYLRALSDLRDRRMAVEARGNPNEYEALAREYAAIGAQSNADNLLRKARNMRGVK